MDPFSPFFGAESCNWSQDVFFSNDLNTVKEYFKIDDYIAKINPFGC